MESEQPLSPIQLNIDYPVKLNRLTTLFRVILIIPIFFVLAFISEGSIIIHSPSLVQESAYGFTNPAPANDIVVIDTNTTTQHYYSHTGMLAHLMYLGSAATTSTTAFLFLGPLVMLLFRKKYPRWWFNWNVELIKFLMRITAYLYCLTDQYPSTDEEQRIHMNIPYIDGSALNRGLPLVKWFLAIPHYVILFVLGVIAVALVLLSWIWVIITSHYPRPFFNYIVGVMRWNLRVTCYAILLTTDKYPPFSFKA